MATNAVGNIWHQGSWGTPELGWTEFIGGLLGGNKSNQGGSDIIPNQPTPTSTNTTSTSNNGATNSWAPTSTPTNPKPTPTNNNNNTGGGNSFDDIYNRFYQGWDRNSAMADYRANPNKFANQMGGGGGQDMSGLIDSIYGPAYQALNERADFLQNVALPNLNSEVETGASQALGDLAVQYSNLRNEATRQQDTLGHQNQTSLDTLLRNYNALQQQGQSRYGGGSSTGRAVSDLTGQEYLRNRNQLDVAYTGEVGKIAERFVQIDMTEQQAKQKIEQDKRLAIQKNNQNLQQELLQINTARYQLDSDRASKQYEAIQKSVDNAKRIQDMFLASQEELRVWKEKMSFAAQDQFNKLTSSFSPINNITTPQNQFLNPSGQTNITSNILSSLPYLRSGKKVDELGRLIEPNVIDDLG